MTYKYKRYGFLHSTTSFTYTLVTTNAPLPAVFGTSDVFQKSNNKRSIKKEYFLSRGELVSVPYRVATVDVFHLGSF